MSSTFFGLEIGSRALVAEQQALNTTSHNIANANTPGYSRQVVQLSETDPFSPPSFSRPTIPGMIGTGVEVTSVERMRDDFVDNELRNESQSLGRWTTKKDQLSEVELIFTEPSDSGIRSALDGLWTSLEGLSSQPDQGPTRSVVVQKAQALTTAFNHTYQQMIDLQSSIDKTIAVKVDAVNSLSTQVASLNDQIMKAQAAGLQPNDLKDQRGELIKSLSKMVDVTTYAGSQGDVTVSVGGSPLVDGNQAFALQTVPDITNNNYLTIQWASNGTPARVLNGEIKGLQEMRDEVIPGYRQQLDTLANQIITQFNAQHEAGYDLNGAAGGEFFTGTGAADMAVAAGITADVSKIAAASQGAPNPAAPGDGSNASKMAGLKAQAFLPGSMTFGDYYGALISGVGVDGQEAGVQATNSDALVAHLENQQEAVAGVSLDEEMTNLIKYQHGYNAAARVITVMDEALSTIINNMGSR